MFWIRGTILGVNVWQPRLFSGYVMICESLPGMVILVSKIGIETSVKTCHTDLLNAVESSYHCVSGSG